MKNFPYYKQVKKKDCGPTCLKMIAKYYGRSYDTQYLLDNQSLYPDGFSMLDISEAARKLGFEATGVKLHLNELIKAKLPCILHWNQEHFIVLYKISKVSSPTKRVYHIADPAIGLVEYKERDFLICWCGTTGIQNPKHAEGIALLLHFRASL